MSTSGTVLDISTLPFVLTMNACFKGVPLPRGCGGTAEDDGILDDDFLVDDDPLVLAGLNDTDFFVAADTDGGLCIAPTSRTPAARK